MKFSFDNFQEFLDWNLKRENHIKDLNEQIRSMGVEHAKRRDNLYDENNRLLIENDEYETEIAKLTEELSEAHYKIKRLEERANTFEYENGRYIKVEDVPQALKKSPAATDDE